jgi:hypothetical protein
LTGRPGEDLRAIRSGDSFEIPVDLPAGEYLVGVYVSGPKGEAGYSFRVAVEREPGGRS